MRCVTDLTHVSTNSLPSTLLKKTGGRNQVPFHDRVVPPPITALALVEKRNDNDYHELSSVSTQSSQLTPYGNHDDNKTELIREVSLDNKDLPKGRINPHSRRSVVPNRPRRPSPERCIQSTKGSPTPRNRITTNNP
jgi:hypothetical protein